MFYYRIDKETELRILELRYAEALFQLTDSCRDYLREWLPWVDATQSPEDTKSFIRFSLKQFAENNGFTAGIFYNGQIAGTISFHSFDWVNKSTSIGYWLGESFQGKGMMTKAVKALVDYAILDLGLNRVVIKAAVNNHKSRAIPERLGFVLEGIEREAEWVNDRFLDLVVYSMLAKDWREKQ